MEQERLASERVIVEAPMSYTGATKRLWRLTDPGDHLDRPRWLEILIVIGVAFAIPVAWVLITSRYFVFGLFLVPYRLIRRGQRKRKMEELRHREMLAATNRRH